MSVKVQISADIPELLLQNFLQYIRNYDVAHDGCHFEVAAAAPGMSTDQMKEMLEGIKPPFATTAVMQKQ